MEVVMFMNIGKRCRELRESKGLSIYKLSELTGLSNTHISDIEREIKMPTFETLSRLLKPLEISMSEFFNESDNLIYATNVEKELVYFYRKMPPNKAKLLMEVFRLFSEDDCGKS